MGGAMQKGKPAKRYSQAGRVHDIIRMIEARHGITIEEMAEESGVNRRTIHRDLVAIQEAGYPLVSEWLNGRKVYRFLTRFKDIPPINFTLQELLTLSFFRSQLDFLRGTPFSEDMSAIFRKVNSVLPPRYAAHMERIARVSLPLLQGIREYGRVAGQIKLLREALLFQYRVTITYRTKGEGEPAAYEVDPYTLLFFKGGLYLVGYAHNRQALRTFAVERIVEVTVGRDRFELPDDYSPEEQFGAAFGIVGEAAERVKVRFAPEVAYMVRDRQWHPSQKASPTPDGGLVLEFVAGGRMEIIAWVLSYGQYAELIEPAEWRGELQGITASMQRIYNE
jgi:proteasome accessory factor B